MSDKGHGSSDFGCFFGVLVQSRHEYVSRLDWLTNGGQQACIQTEEIFTFSILHELVNNLGKHRISCPCKARAYFSPGSVFF